MSTGNVRIGSIVRDGGGWLPRYFVQVQELAAQLWAKRDRELSVILLEGDSSDDSWEQLISWQAESKLPIQVLKFSHGGKKYPSINKPDRWANIAKCWNYLFSWQKHEAGIDAFIYVEADLIWEPATMIQLLDDLEIKGVDGVAPMSMLNPDFFYDIWGHRADGLHFTNGRPFHPWLAPDAKVPAEAQNGNLLKIDSAGSCMAMRWEIVQRCTFSPVDAMIGPDMNAKGYGLWLDKTLAVRHP